MLSNPYRLLFGNCTEQMRIFADNSIDAIVTDPPYGINFMNSKWDCPGDMLGQMATGKTKCGALARGGSHNRGYKDCDNAKFQSYMTPIFAEALRVAKPGAHLLAFGGTRTFHRLACAIEDAGWEIRDCIMWIYGEGFPKSMDVGKAIDKMKGVERKKIRNPNPHKSAIGTNTFGDYKGDDIIQPFPVSPEAAEWQGWGTCLKPAVEPIIVARKPLDGTVAANVLKYGTGAINIDGCRVPTDDNLNGGAYSKSGGRSALTGDERDEKGKGMFAPGKTSNNEFLQPQGRFPANLIHDGSDEVLALFPNSNGSGHARTLRRSAKPEQEGWGMNKHAADSAELRDAGSGSAARFFYCAKASRKERGEGNDHPTLKPLALMRYLVRLVTRKGGIVLDPFMGSGTTGVAAIQEGMNFIGIERDKHYFEIARLRISGGCSTSIAELEPIQMTFSVP